jgi:radical SAM superfamily enzyme YgiQ (UPF0313 family)
MIGTEGLIAALGPGLFSVDKPARYLGGESGATHKADAALRMALCFPDLYEIGMSNNAMRILYAGLNRIEGLSCERVFAPADDFAALLKERGLGLYGLESLRPIREADLLGFTIGYELAATNVLAVLRAAGLALKASERGDDDPIVIAGGPAITNPAPYAVIFDGVWIGEAEGDFFALAEGLVALKKAGGGKRELLAKLDGHPAFWRPGKRAVRAVFEGFSEAVYGHNYPIPVLKPVQDHGVVEIMRGCPNACRFCHAGYFYRPQRLRDPEAILKDVESQVRDAGQRQITLSSLSSGDYPGIFELLRLLNERWASQGVSFQLPSLKVESFPLELVEEVSGTRKSGLTFAVETPLEQWQLTINKTVRMETIRRIAAEAERRGYRVAKFYFMIGLPLPEAELSEEDAIIAFIRELSASTRLAINLTISTFVPKPHTPFQWARQITPEEAARRIYAIKDALRPIKGIKISYHGPFQSWIEGAISRGGERVGELIIRAFELGARFDAWDDRFKKDAWVRALEELAFTEDDISGARSLEDPLPWDSVSIRVSKRYLAEEHKRSIQNLTTSACIDSCTARCGACSDSLDIADTNAREQLIKELERLRLERPNGEAPIPSTRRPGDSPDQAAIMAERSRHLFEFQKEGVAAFYPHHTVWAIIASAFERAGIALEYSHGFNPSPRLELSEPLSLGIESKSEFGMTLMKLGSVRELGADELARVARFLPSGIRIKRCRLVQGYEGRKVPSLSAAYWGALYSLNLPVDTGAARELQLAALNALLSEAEALSGSEASVDPTSGDLLIKLKAGGSREFGLHAVILKALGLDLREGQVKVIRLAQYAKTPAGPTDYWTYYGFG